MDEPTHAQESRFWDHVADWILGCEDPGQSALTQAEIDAWLAQLRDDAGRPQSH
ncbi:MULTISPECIES: hypothetical protein [Ramlibacter]|uniref:Uncharacterized protein n=1 Tax=Ramlibacter aquaticus TaxID=2780094 RepID=A0ABR9SK60_9BURK|nr:MULTISPECIES: hypothetical protein [Ramlibacter]MBE7942756.1 hypothetical protein [Ramlibacter aquaticus]